MLFLGFTDDVLEWGWAAKLVLPTVSSIPLVAVYDGSTSIVAPRFMHAVFWMEDRRLVWKKYSKERAWIEAPDGKGDGEDD